MLGRVRPDLVPVGDACSAQVTPLPPCSDDLLLYFQRDLSLVDHWLVNGREYERTCNEWLIKMDAHKADVLRVLGETYGQGQANQQYGKWRIFMMSCAELFGYENGNQWAVSHYLFENGKAAKA